MLKKSLIMLKKCTYSSPYIAHYAQVEPTMNNKANNKYYEETWFKYTCTNIECGHFN